MIGEIKPEMVDGKPECSSKCPQFNEDSGCPICNEEECVPYYRALLAAKGQPIIPFEASRFPEQVAEVLSGIEKLLVTKNQAYGNSALDPIRIFSRGDSTEQLLVRIDDKLSRIGRGSGEIHEDTIDDLIGYLVLLKIANAEIGVDE